MNHEPSFGYRCYRQRLLISSRHSNLNFVHHFVIYWLLQNCAKKNQHQESHQRETIHDQFVIFAKLVRQNKSTGWSKYVYVKEICADGIFVSFFPWWLKMWKVGQNSLFFQMIAILKFDFQKRKQLRFSEDDLNYTKKTQFACDKYIFPKTRANKNK